MAKLFDNVKVNIATTGTGTLTFGSKVSNAFATPAEAGAADADPVVYILRDGNDWEIGDGVVGGSVTTMTRTVRKSSISGTVGTSALNLSGTATLALIAGAADFDDRVSFIAAQSKTAAQQAQARTNVSAALKGHLYGLALSNNGSDPTNDIDIAVGETASTETNPVLMVLASALTKRLDAAWAVGSGNGGLDTGSIANTTYHVWLIQRSDTGVVDALFSTSATTPTMPTNYDRKRRIGAIIRQSGAILAFVQDGDDFRLSTPINDQAAVNPGTTSTLYALSVPGGIQVDARIAVLLLNTASAANALISSPLESVQVSNGIAGNMSIATSGAGVVNGLEMMVRTNSSRQVRAVCAASGNNSLWLTTKGWIDNRGRFAA